MCSKIGDRSIFFEATTDGIGYIFDNFTLLTKEGRWILLNNDTDKVAHEQEEQEKGEHVDKIASFIG